MENSDVGSDFAVDRGNAYVDNYKSGRFSGK